MDEAKAGPLFSIVIAVTTLLFAWLIYRWYAKRGKSTISTLLGEGPAPTSSRQAARNAAPDTYLARWTVAYHSFDSEVTSRTVRVVEVKPRLQQFIVWCELRQGERTLSFHGLHQIIDTHSGVHVELDEWLEAYRLSRRRAKTT